MTALLRSKAWLGRLAALAALALFAIFLFLSVRSLTEQYSLQNVHLAPGVFAALLPLAVSSFALRALRLHFLLRPVVPNLTLPLTLRTQSIGFALAVSPGRVGEFYKLQAVQQATGVPVAKSLPAVLAERLTDLSAFAAVALLGAWLSWSQMDGQSRVLGWLGLGLAVILGAFVYQLGGSRALDWLGLSDRTRLRTWRDRLVVRFPLVTKPLTMLRQLWLGSTQLASPRVLGLALAAVILARFADALVIYLLTQAVGYPVSFPVALLMLGLTGLAGGISLAPGGMGAAEAALTALAVAQGIPFDSALTIALITRALTFWLWVVIGLMVFTVGLATGILRRPSPQPANSNHPDQ